MQTHCSRTRCHQGPPWLRNTGPSEAFRKRQFHYLPLGFGRVKCTLCYRGKQMPGSVVLSAQTPSFMTNIANQPGLSCAPTPQPGLSLSVPSCWTVRTATTHLGLASKMTPGNFCFIKKIYIYIQPSYTSYFLPLVCKICVHNSWRFHLLIHPQMLESKSSRYYHRLILWYASQLVLFNVCALN